MKQLGEIKTCPFCGKIPKRIMILTALYGVECKNEDCLVRPFVYAHTQEDADKAWNKRDDE